MKLQALTSHNCMIPYGKIDILTGRCENNKSPSDWELTYHCVKIISQHGNFTVDVFAYCDKHILNHKFIFIPDITSTSSVKICSAQK